MAYFDTKEDSLEEAIKAAVKNEKMDAVNKTAVKKKFDDRKDKDIDNDGDVDSSDKYLHKRRKAVSKAIAKENLDVGTPENTKSKLDATPGQSVDEWEQQVETIQKKNSSMRERLAQIWGMDEGNSPFEKDKKKEEKIPKKTMTGEPVTKVEVDPKINDQ